MAICILCGKEFIPKPYNRSVCYEDHYHACPICGKPVLANDPQKQSSCCSRACAYKKASISREKSTLEKYGVDNVAKLEGVRQKISSKVKEMQYTHTCKLCGETFVSSNAVAYVCPKPHYATCVVCGKSFVLTWPYNQKTCSLPCRSQYVRTSGISQQRTSKAQQTLRDRYGVNNCMKLDSVKKKVKDTIKQHYGVEHALQNPEILHKSQQTCQANYGVPHPAQNKEILSKMANTTLEKYGVTNYFLLSNHVQSMMTDPSKYEQWISFKEDPAEFIQDNYSDTPSAQQLCEDLGVTNTMIYSHLIQHNVRDLVTYRSSSMEREVVDFLLSLDENINIIRNDRKEIHPYELDILLPDYKLAIECNPTWTHNSTIPDPWGCQCKPRDYHAMKSNMCQREGIRLIHLFGYEWVNKQDVLKSMISNALGFSSHIVYARNTKVVSLDMAQTKRFLNHNHRQGYCSYKYSIGLMADDQLVSIMTFGYPRSTMGKTKDCTSDMELLRFCNKLDHVVVGGASKLFSYFIKKYNPVRMISFSDVAHTTGNMYNKLGFRQISISSPNYVWVDPKTEKYFTRVACQKRNLSKLFNEPNLDVQNQTEKQIMEQHGYVQVFDSGAVRWEWTPQNR